MRRRRTGDQPPVPRAGQRLRPGPGVHQHPAGSGTRSAWLPSLAAVLQVTSDQDVDVDADRHQQRHGQGVLRPLHVAGRRGPMVGGRVRTGERRQRRGPDVRVHHRQNVRRPEEG